MLTETWIISIWCSPRTIDASGSDDFDGFVVVHALTDERVVHGEDDLLRVTMTLQGGHIYYVQIVATERLRRRRFDQWNGKWTGYVWRWV